ncbi:MAG: TolC family protein [Chitinophagaceae bacterium]|nr:TolC family protein [Chitinophagaceae bacterium]
MRSIRYVFLLLNILFVAVKPGAAADTTALKLNAEQVLSILRQYHPVIRQAQIGVEQSGAALLNARAGFDPLLSTYIGSKTFTGTDYYTDISPELKIPTWFGIDVFAGTSDLSGNRLDPTRTAGESSLVGVNIPLAKGLLMDKRRAALQQAKIFKTMALTEQRALINDLSFAAMENYWYWVRAYQAYLVIKNTVKVNEKRLLLVRKAYANGERPAIDTTEALTQLLSFRYQENEQFLEFQNAGLQLSAYLWTAEGTPYNLPEYVQPDAAWDNEIQIEKFNVVLANLLDLAAQYHPDLMIYDFKIEALTIERKLKFQELLPKIDFRYNQLGKGYDFAKTVDNFPLFENNYQYALKFEMPLRLSGGRGAYKMAKLKIENTQLDQDQKRQQVAIKVKSYFNEWAMLRNQVELQSENYKNYQRMVSAEETKFANGESSLFLINSRENKALDALQKLIAVKTKYFKTLYALQWSAGLLQ